MRELGAYETAGPEVAAGEAEQQGAAGQAVEFLRARWAAFLALDRALLDLAHRAAVASAESLARGDMVRHELARASVERIAELRALHDRATRMFDQVRDAIPPLQGLGVVPLVPLAVVGIVLALAAMVTFIFSRVNAEERIVRLLESGQLTPEQADSLLANADQPSGPEGLASTIKWVLGGVVLLALLRTFRETR